MRAKHSVLVVVVCIAVLMLTLGLPTASARGTSGAAMSYASNHTIVVYPNGHDDTSDIQAAFNACVSYGPGCTVQLVKGTYYITQIAVTGFQGSFLGLGQGVTIIQGLPTLASPGSAYNTSTVPFWGGLPGPGNPWPVLLTLVNGNYRISGMTITDTYYNPVPGGWNFYGTAITQLYATILVTGEQASAAIDHVTAIGGAGQAYIGAGPTPDSFNGINGIDFEGMLLPTPTSPLSDQIPLIGTFTLMNSVMEDIYGAFAVENLLNAQLTACYNSISGSPLPSLIDLSNTQVWFCGNQVTNAAVGAGLYGAQSQIKTDLLPSTVYVTDNYFEVNWGADGPYFVDLGPSEGLPASLSAVVTGNTIVTDTSCGCYTLAYPVIFGYDLSSLVVSGNVVRSGGTGVLITNLAGNVGSVSGNTVLGAMVGVALGASTTIGYDFSAPAYGIAVTANVVKNSADYGIIVVGGSSNNVVAFNYVKGSGLYDLYWDQTGTGDFWFWNIYSTSYPAVLP